MEATFPAVPASLYFPLNLISLATRADPFLVPLFLFFPPIGFRAKNCPNCSLILPIRQATGFAWNVSLPALA